MESGDQEYVYDDSTVIMYGLNKDGLYLNQ